LQSAPQLMPAGVEVTVPAPVPVLVTDTDDVATEKLPLTVVGPVRVTAHEPVPEQPPPDQPAKL
jgi:hypothetical protein